MSLIILEGLDRTGKSSVAAHFETKGYELIHQNAPAKGTTPDQFLEEMVQLVSSASNKDIVLDRSYYGELVWPSVFGRESILTEENLEALKEIEASVGTLKILMTDPNVEAHWQRCVDNNEPLNRVQFSRARTLYSQLGDKHDFQRKTLKDFPEAQKLTPVSEPKQSPGVVEVIQPQNTMNETLAKTLPLSKEQLKLETANAINDILSKRIIKQKGQVYEQIEANLRTYLNNELGKLLGTKTETKQFTDEEVDLLKFFANKLKTGK